MKYDYLVVGAGIFGATVAERLADAGRSVLMIDRRMHLAGNAYSYTDDKTGIEVHKYGSHIFHTESNEVWEYVNKFTKFNDYIHTVKTRHDGVLYPMPINLDTINIFYGTNMKAEEAKRFIANEIRADMERLGIVHPDNFREKGISLVGERLYDAFLKNYTEKQWGRRAEKLSSELLNRIPVRYSRNNRYFMTAKYQGIPELGYTKMIEKMLDSERISVRLGVDFKSIENELSSDIGIVYSGQVDELLDYKYGVLPWRSLRFEVERTEKTLGQAVINEADAEILYTRAHDFKYYQIHEPKVLRQPESIIMREYPKQFRKGGEAYYPVNNAESSEVYERYVALAKIKYPRLLLGGRLGLYRYLDMDQTILEALKTVTKLI